MESEHNVFVPTTTKISNGGSLLIVFHINKNGKYNYLQYTLYMWKYQDFK